MTIRNRVATIKQAAREKLGEKIERYDLMLDAELIAMPFGIGNFTSIVLGPVVKTHSRQDGACGVSVVERRHGIHAAAEKDDGFVVVIGAHEILC